MKKAALLVNEIGSTSEIEFSVLHDRRYPVHQIAERLEPYLRVIVARFHPQRIILFGSYAHGQPTEHSDVDLLIVRSDITSERECNIAMRRAFWGLSERRLPFTLLSKTPAELQAKLDEHSPFFQEIMEQGVELYAA